MVWIRWFPRSSYSPLYSRRSRSKTDTDLTGLIIPTCQACDNPVQFGRTTHASIGNICVNWARKEQNCSVPRSKSYWPSPNLRIFAKRGLTFVAGFHRGTLRRTRIILALQLKFLHCLRLASRKRSHLFGLTEKNRNIYLLSELLAQLTTSYLADFFATVKYSPYLRTSVLRWLLWRNQVFALFLLCTSCSEAGTGPKLDLYLPLHTLLDFRFLFFPFKIIYSIFLP